MDTKVLRPPRLTRLGVNYPKSCVPQDIVDTCRGGEQHGKGLIGKGLIGKAQSGKAQRGLPVEELQRQEAVSKLDTHPIITLLEGEMRYHRINFH